MLYSSFKPKRRRVSIVTFRLLALMTLAMTLQPVVAAGLPWGMLDQTGCCHRCPSCDHECKFKAESVKEARSGFDVESKVICIPRVVFPWQKRIACESCEGRGCQQCHNGGRTRRVCVLKTETYECPACKYSWSAEEKPCRSRRCGTPCSDEYCVQKQKANADCDKHIFYLQSETAAGMLPEATR